MCFKIESETSQVFQVGDPPLWAVPQMIGFWSLAMWLSCSTPCRTHREGIFINSADEEALQKSWWAASKPTQNSAAE